MSRHRITIPSAGCTTTVITNSTTLVGAFKHTRRRQETIRDLGSFMCQFTAERIRLDQQLTAPQMRQGGSGNRGSVVANASAI
jgi:hypothetical protein